MKVQLPIDPFQLTQGFGERPEVYKQFGLAGHNGWDMRTKWPDTPEGRRAILATQDSQFYRKGVDPSGYGNFFEVLVKAKSLWKITFAHCHSIDVFSERKQGQQMAISDNSGFSTGAHLHGTWKRIRIENSTHIVLDYNNGYFGAVNPQEYFDEVRNFDGLQPIPMPTINIEGALYEKLVGNSTKWDQIHKYLELPGLPDTASYEDAQRVVAGLKSRNTDLYKQLREAQQERDNRIEQVGRLEKQLLEEGKLKAELLKKLNDAIAGQPGIVKVYEDRIAVLQGQIDNTSKELGRVKNELATCQAGSNIDELTVGDVLILLFNKLKQVKLR